MFFFCWLKLLKAMHENWMPYKKRCPTIRIYFQLFRQKYTSSNNSVAEPLTFDAANMKDLHLIRQWASVIYFPLLFPFFINFVHTSSSRSKKLELPKDFLTSLVYTFCHIVVTCLTHHNLPDFAIQGYS